MVEFDPETGLFTWVVAYRKPWMTGRAAARPMTNGYLYIKAGGKMVSASRLAYKLAYGVDPGLLEIDHINRIRDDNRPENLRLVDRARQLENRKFRPNRTGYTGVSLHQQSGLYRARRRGKTTYHKTPEAAAGGYAHLGKEHGNY